MQNLNWYAYRPCGCMNLTPSGYLPHIIVSDTFKIELLQLLYLFKQGRNESDTIEPIMLIVMQSNNCRKVTFYEYNKTKRFAHDD